MMKFKDWLQFDEVMNKYRAVMPNYKQQYMHGKQNPDGYSTQDVISRLKTNWNDLKSSQNLDVLSRNLQKAFDGMNIVFTVAPNRNAENSSAVFSQATFNPDQPNQTGIEISNATFDAIVKRQDFNEVIRSMQYMLSHELSHMNQFKNPTASLQRHFDTRHSNEIYDAFGVTNDKDLLARWTDLSNYLENGEKPELLPKWITDDQMLQKAKAAAMNYYTNPSEFPAHAQSAMFELLNAVRTGKLKLPPDKRTFIRFVNSIRPNNVGNYIQYSSELANYYTLAEKKQLDAKTFISFLQLMQQSAAKLPENEFTLADSE